jgi:peroxin-7
LGIQPKLGSRFYLNSTVTCSSWSPLYSSTYSTTSADGSLQIWGMSDPSDKPALEVMTSSSDLLCCDWNKFNPNLIMTGSSDGSICGWDLRSLVGPVSVMRGHKKAVNRVKCSPHSEGTTASVSCDQMTKIWDQEDDTLGSDPLLLSIRNHSDSVCGLDFNPALKGQIVDCGWDQIISLFFIK